MKFSRDANAAYSHFFQKIMTVIDKIAPFKAKRVKGDIQKWFDGEFLEELNSRVNYFRNLKSLDSTLTKSYLRKQNTRR